MFYIYARRSYSPVAKASAWQRSVNAFDLIEKWCKLKEEEEKWCILIIAALCRFC